MSITTKAFGMNQDSQPVTMYTLTNAIGASVSIIDFGGIITSIIVPDKAGSFADVCTGFDHIAPYLVDNGNMGALIGRYGNRIAKGHMTIDGTDYSLYINNGENHLHGGKEGYGVRMWHVEQKPGDDGDSLVLTRLSPDMEENYPGNLHVTVTYTFDNECNLSIHYQGVTDKATHVNMTNHAYFNLAGHESGTICDHLLMVDADVITKVDAGLIPTGEMAPVAGTPFDLRHPKRLGDGIEKRDQFPQMACAGGYDHNYVLGKGCQMGLAARLVDPKSGRVMEVITDQPGIQVYSACTTDFTGGKGGAYYGNFCALCLETQHHPDTPNHPTFPSTLVRPEETYDTTTIYAFRAE